jgi:hypothetical protein
MTLDLQTDDATATDDTEVTAIDEVYEDLQELELRVRSRRKIKFPIDPPPSSKGLESILRQSSNSLTLEKVEETKEHDEDYELPPDLYSMLFVNGLQFTKASTFALVTICQQFVIVGLFYFDLLSGGTSKNRLNLPVDTTVWVRTAQFLALPLAVMAHENCTTALCMLRIPYDPQILKEAKFATRRSWSVALFLRFLIGFLLVFVSFIQIMQAETITDLFLNLESIVFVGQLDKATFWLAKSGFLKKELVCACDLTENIRFRD